jgi:N-acylneuraminate cytidylyltransferase
MLTNNICIIPARGGSKRIPRKNIKLFLGKPIIAYSIEAAINSKIFDEIMVSTDDIEIATIAKEYGAKVPFFRSEKNSNDFSTTAVVIEEVIFEYKKFGKYFDQICCCYPTAPFITPERLTQGLELLENNEVESVFPIVEFDYPILRSFKLNDSKYLDYNWPEYINSRSQDLPISYHDSGQWYWIKAAAFKAYGNLFTPKTKAIQLSTTEVQDIDNENDWNLAELKFRKIWNY